ncbi:MAG: hypothetical protein K2Y21_12965 [Phycisphaerales bacterium]|nr:hypothetical protein [Phycisphaerales bacterium]
MTTSPAVAAVDMTKPGDLRPLAGKVVKVSGIVDRRKDCTAFHSQGVVIQIPRELDPGGEPVWYASVIGKLRLVNEPYDYTAPQDRPDWDGQYVQTRGSGVVPLTFELVP